MPQDIQTLQFQKAQLRKSCRATREQLPIAELSLAIGDVLAQCPLFQEARRILFYHPFRQEVDLLALAHSHPGKAWFLPVSDPESLRLTFQPYRQNSALQSGQYGIVEPFPIEDAYCPQGRDDLMLLPGLAFDSAGGRLGYGKGYYDRFMAQCAAGQGSPPVTIGVCPSALLLEEVPMQAWDMPMDYIATEIGLLKTRPRPV